MTRALWLLAILLFFPLKPANAATFIISKTENIHQILANSHDGAFFLYTDQLMISQGDEVIINISFADDVGLIVNTINEFDYGLNQNVCCPPANASITFTSTIDFFNPSSNLQPYSNTITRDRIFAPYEELPASAFSNEPGPYVFSGFRLTVHFDAFSDSLPHTYSGYFFYIQTNDFSLTSVPELNTWAMMIFGFGGIGASLRRRPHAAVKFA